MKTKTLVKRTGALINPPKGLVARNGEIVQNETFLEFVDFAGRLQNELDDCWAAMYDFMQNHKVHSAKGEWGHITIAAGKRTLSIEKGATVDPSLLKDALDTQKVRAWQKLFGEDVLPEGVNETLSKPYLTKKLTATYENN